MDPETRTRLRYDRLRKTIADQSRVQKKARLWRVIWLCIIGAWLILPTLFWALDEVTWERREYFRTPTPHEAYRLSLGEAALLESGLGWDWLEAASAAIMKPLAIRGAYLEEGFFPAEDPQALGFRLRVPEGQRLTLEVEGMPDSEGQVFVDLFRAAPDTLLPPARLQSGELSGEPWTFDSQGTSDYVLRVQPELLRGGRYRLAIRVGARWGFPVADSGEEDIGGFFGDPRDGGRRRHHGVDIFSRRGTPVLAAARGRISAVDTTAIGGRVVWQRDETRAYSLYYAHLDRPLVREGQEVQPGDTIGLMGNTGNARTTPPHLHFGAYRRGRGAVDPWGFILPQAPPLPRVAVDREAIGGWGRVVADQARLRRSPSAQGAVLAELADEETVRVAGGAGEWYRVLLSDGRSGFVAESLIQASGRRGTLGNGHQ